jgi:hypothetical protein
MRFLPFFLRVPLQAGDREFFFHMHRMADIIYERLEFLVFFSPGVFAFFSCPVFWSQWRLFAATAINTEGIRN